MNRYIIGKILVVIIILIPVFFFNSCNKQEKCGCDGDVLFSITKDNIMYNPMNYSSLYVSPNGANMQFSIGYDTYSFCNPVEMYEVYKTLTEGAQIRIEGDVYWDCSYVSSAGQSSYYYYYKYYNIHVTSMESQLYGK